MIGKKILSALSVPEEVVYDLPCISLIGNKTFSIENYQGILEYSLEKIRIKTPCGTVKIEGTDLSIKSITYDSASIVGTISKIEY